MGSRCARCGGDEQVVSFYPRPGWIEYLRTERSISNDSNNWTIPLCPDCHERAWDLRSPIPTAAPPSEEARAFLEELDRGALVEHDAFV